MVTTEVLVIYRADGDAEIEVEAPQGEAVRSEDESNLPKARVVGTIRNKDREPVEGARIISRGTTADARTDSDGTFEIFLPVGLRQITVIHPNYATANQEIELQDVEGPGPEKSLDIRLESRAATLAELVVTVPRIEGGTVFVLKERQEASAVSDILGADQISKQGDSDAASALSRVTGVTIVDGKFVFIRGLGERYSFTLLDGSIVPSPEPARRVIPLDLFPAGIISSLVVQKTYAPNLPGEFGGGVVDIRTKDIPEDFTLSVSASVGARSTTTFTDGKPSYEGTDTDFLGFGIEGRQLPDVVADVEDLRLRTPLDPPGAGLNRAQFERVTEALGSEFVVNRQFVPPDFGVGVTVGGKKEFGDVRIGAMAAADYDNSWELRQPFTNRNYAIADNVIQLQDSFEATSLYNEITLSALGTFGVDITQNHELRYTLSVNRISENEATDAEGISIETGAPRRTIQFRWVEKMLVSNQWRGHHVLPALGGLEVDYRYSLSLAFRDEPNRLRLGRNIEPTSGRFTFDQDGNERFFSELDDQIHDVGVDLTYPIELFDDLVSKLIVGGNFADGSRTVDVRRFNYGIVNLNSPSVDESIFRGQVDPGTLFEPDFVEPNFFQLRDLTRNDDNYDANFTLLAGYIMGDIQFPAGFKLTTGVRVEQSDQEVLIVSRLGREVQDRGDLSTFDPLPSVLLTWEFIENMQIRLGYARTLNRPSIRELSPSPFIDIVTGRIFRGNLELERAIIDHYDLRWEWYPSPGESVSVALFAKTFQDPIEFEQRTGAGIVTFRPINAEGAQNLGIELEMRKNFEFLADWTGVGFFEPFYFAGNVAIVESSVTLPEATQLTSTDRPLQGQSPYVINTILGYENLESGTNLTLLFNVFGARIDSVGIQGIPDVYEQSFPRLDFVASQSLGRIQLSAKVKNILNPPVKLTLGDDPDGLIFQRFFRGIEGSLGISVDLD
ncbi:MAG: TonB-dependent receptor [Myxococcales bacterium]|nr:TonB-dependent receptor [Myxococcales bacterium]